MSLPVPPILLITDRTMVRVSLEAVLDRAFVQDWPCGKWTPWAILAAFISELTSIFASYGSANRRIDSTKVMRSPGSMSFSRTMTHRQPP